MDILKKAVGQAVTLLNSCGARYHIIEADGTVHGAPVVPEKKRRTRTVNPDLPSYLSVFKEKIGPMQIGDVVVLTPYDGDSTNRLQSNIGAFCGHRFGQGCVMTTRNGNTVEVLRIK